MRDMAIRNRAAMRERHHGAKLREGDAEGIIAAVDAGERVADVAKRYGITPSRVSMIRYGHSRWVDGVKRPTGRSDRMLTDEQALAIYATTGPLAPIAQHYGVSPATIRDIRVGKSYFRVTGARTK